MLKTNRTSERSSLALRHGLIALFLLAAPLYDPALAQEAISFPDTLMGWKSSARFNLNGTQVSYRNWAKGGVNSISATGGTTFTILYKDETFQYGSRLTLRYGRAKIDGDGSRKTDDLIHLRNRFLYDITHNGLPIKLFANLQFQTQFDEGYEYGKTQQDPDILISKYFAPALVTENVGLAWMPWSFLSVEAGLGLKQTIVHEERLATRYGLSEGDRFRNEGGVTIGVDFEKEIAKNVTYTASVGTFSSVGEAIKATDVNVANLIVGKINSYLNTTFQLNLVYDRDYSTELQVSQVLAVGFSITI